MTLKTPGENGRTAAGAEVTAYLIAKATFTSRGIDYVLDDDFAETRLDLDDNITQSMVSSNMPETITSPVSLKDPVKMAVLFSTGLRQECI